MAKNGDLTDKQAAFVREYLVDLCATQAAIRAGYSGKTAGAIGRENLQKPLIAAAITSATVKRTERTEVTQDWVISRLVENVERSMQADPVLDRKGNRTGEYTYGGSVANRALELLGKHLGMFSENLNIRTPDGPLQIAITYQVAHASNNGPPNRVLALQEAATGNGSGKQP